MAVIQPDREAGEQLLSDWQQGHHGRAVAHSVLGTLFEIAVTQLTDWQQLDRRCRQHAGAAAVCSGNITTAVLPHARSSKVDSKQSRCAPRHAQVRCTAL